MVPGRISGVLHPQGTSLPMVYCPCTLFRRQEGKGLLLAGRGGLQARQGRRTQWASGAIQTLTLSL